MIAIAQLPPPRARRSEAWSGKRSDEAERAPPQEGGATVYVGLVTRAIAMAIDCLLIDVAALAVAGAVLLVNSVFGVSGGHHTLAAALGGLLFGVWAVCYFGAFWTTTGQTPGNRVMQIRVARADGTRLKPRHALVRLVGLVLSLPLLWGFVPILMSARRRGVFDVMAGTVVTVIPPPKPRTSERGSPRAEGLVAGAEERI